MSERSSPTLAATASFIPNPIIPGFAPDPSVTRVGDTYFLATSSFHLFPGIPIYASKDLASWQHLGNAINRRDQLSLSQSSTRLKTQDDGSGQFLCATGGLYAPTIRHKNGVTYVICTNFVHDGDEDYRLENFIVSTQDIWSDEWSDPVYFDWIGIDPDLFWDGDGRVYVVGSAWKENPRAYISCMEIDINTGATLSPEQEIWDGFTKVIPEGPHLYKRDGYYYLLVSEGGTSENHCLTMARSRCIWGPYESCDRNPLLKPAPQDAPVQHTGHGDLFQDADGHWRAACLGVRKFQGRYHMGRESFLTKAQWLPGEWPTIEPVPEHIGDADLSSFDVLKIDGSGIDIRPSKVDLAQMNGAVSFVGKRQRRLKGTSSARLLMGTETSATQCKAGLAIYKDEHRFARIYWDGASSTVKLALVNRAKSLETMETFTLPSLPERHLTFRLEHTAEMLKWFFRRDQDDEVCAGAMSTLGLTNYDFVGPVVGLFAVDRHEKPSHQVVVKFRKFRVD